MASTLLVKVKKQDAYLGGGERRRLVRAIGLDASNTDDIVVVLSRSKVNLLLSQHLNCPAVG